MNDCAYRVKHESVHLCEHGRVFSPGSVVDPKAHCATCRWRSPLRDPQYVRSRSNILTPHTPRPPREGLVGTELKRLLRKLGITEAGCGCGSHAAMMDAYGLQWCKDNAEQIVTWLVGEAKKRGWAFAPRWGARRLVKRAIRNAERKGTK